jgi:hypothetical protein
VRTFARRNHDLSFDAQSLPKTGPRFGHGTVSAPEEVSEKAIALIRAIPNCEYLCDSGTSVMGVNVWGSPWQPEFCDCALTHSHPPHSLARSP